MDRKELVELLAVDIVNGDWDELPDIHKVLALSQARSVLDAIAAAGLVIVPEEPSADAVEVARCIWQTTGDLTGACRAMIATGKVK